MSLAYNAAIAAKLAIMPERIRALPISPTGFPVPWFIAWFDGVPDFRVIDTPKFARAHKAKLCWVCGQPLGRVFAMTLGPMCAINRTISEPPSHTDCATFSAIVCPFLANPRMRRNERDLPDHREAPGNGLKRNPGAVAVWVTRGYRPFKTSDGGTLFTFDDPLSVAWFAEGRAATRAEVDASIDSGFPLLEAEAKKEGPLALKELSRMVNAAQRWLPAA